MFTMVLQVGVLQWAVVLFASWRAEKRICNLEEALLLLTNEGSLIENGEDDKEEDNHDDDDDPQGMEVTRKQKGIRIRTDTDTDNSEDQDQQYPLHEEQDEAEVIDKMETADSSSSSWRHAKRGVLEEFAPGHPHLNKFLQILFGKHCGDLAREGGSYGMYDFADTIFAFCVDMSLFVIHTMEDEEKSIHGYGLTRKLIEIQLPYHVVLLGATMIRAHPGLSNKNSSSFSLLSHTFSSFTLDHAGMTLYNLITVFVALMWMVMLTIDLALAETKSSNSIAKNGIMSPKESMDDALLFMLDTMIQGKWSCLYGMTSFLGFGIINGFKSISYLVKFPMLYIEEVKKLYDSAQASSSPLCFTALFTVAFGSLLAYPMAYFFMIPRILRASNQLRVAFDHVVENYKTLIKESVASAREIQEGFLHAEYIRINKPKKE